MEEVRLAIAGCGLFAESHLQALRVVGGVRVVAVEARNAACVALALTESAVGGRDIEIRDWR